MSTPVTLEEVMAFPAALPLETIGFHWWFPLLPALAILGLIGMDRAFGKNNVLHTVSHMTFVLGTVLSILYVSFVAHAANPSTSTEYRDYYDEWVQEYVQPYIESLPKEKIELTEARYNYILEDEVSAAGFHVEGFAYGKESVPVYATDAQGKVYFLWADVVYKEGLETPYLTAHILKKDLSFGGAPISTFMPKTHDYKVGLQNIVLYTGDSSFEKYMGEGEVGE